MHRFGVHKTLVSGDVADDDPAASDPEIVTRCFHDNKHWAIVAAKPQCQKLVWDDLTGLSAKRRDYTVTASGIAAPVREALACDIETMSWSPLEFEQQGIKSRSSSTAIGPW